MAAAWPIFPRLNKQLLLVFIVIDVSAGLCSLIVAFFSIPAFPQDAQQFTCSGTMIEPSTMSSAPETALLTIGPVQKVTLDVGHGVVNARRLSNNKVQLKFRTKDFEAEYFRYTGDLFFIYKSGHLMKLMCQKWEG